MILLAKSYLNMSGKKQPDRDKEYERIKVFCKKYNGLNTISSIKLE